MSNPLYATLISLSLLFSCLCCEAEGSLKKDDENKLVVGNIPSGKSQEEGSVECEKGSGTGCKEGGKDDMNERVFENEDYIYTNSNP